MYFCYTEAMKNAHLAPQLIRLLGLSDKEISVLDAIRSGCQTALAVSDQSKVSRQGAYEVLERLQKRGLVIRRIKNGKKYWMQADQRKIEQELMLSKNQLQQEVKRDAGIYNPSDSMITVYRGKDAIRSLFKNLFDGHAHQRFYAMQGDAVVVGWNKIFGVDGTNEINRRIKKNDIIAEGVVPYGWFERQTEKLGKNWAKDFEGRAAMMHEIEEGYFEHGGQFFIFRDSLYLMAMNEGLVIEVRNSEIQKVILSMFSFIEDHAQKFDLNARLRELIANEVIIDKKEK